MEALKDLAVQFLKSSVEKAQRTLSFVPQDKLTWKPAPTAKSALELGAHIGVTLISMSKLFEHRKEKPISVEQLFTMLASEEAKCTSLDSVLAAIQNGAAMMEKAIKAIPASEVESGNIETPFGTKELRRFIFVPEGHTHEHAAQIDYLQTLWGDTEIH